YGENLGWGYSGSGVVDGWYSEKICHTAPNSAECKAIPNLSSNKTGHYDSLVNPEFTVTGAAIAYGTQGYTTGQEYYGIYEPIQWKWKPCDDKPGYMCSDGYESYGTEPENIPTYTLNDYKTMVDEYVATGGWTFYKENQVVNVAAALGGDVSVAGGYAANNQGEARNNIVNIENGATARDIYGAYSEDGKTSGNTVNINGGAIAYVFGGAGGSENATHSNNTVNINGGAVGEVYLGNVGTVSGTVNFLGGKVGILKAVKDANGAATNAVLNIGKDANNPVAMNTLEATGEVGGFNIYNFYLPDTVQNNQWALSADKANLTNATINAYLSGATNLHDKDSIHLITTQSGITGTPTKGTVQVGVTLQLEDTLAVNGNDLDLSFTDPNAPQPPVQEPKVWHISSATQYTTDVSADPQTISGGLFNAADKVADATVNVQANADYNGLNVQGSNGTGGLTLNVSNAKNLGNISDVNKLNQGDGGKKVSISGSSAGEVNIDTKQNSTVNISNSTIGSLKSGAENYNATDKSSVIALDNTTVTGDVSTQKNTLNITNGSNIGGNVAAYGSDTSVTGQTTIANSTVQGDVSVGTLKLENSNVGGTVTTSSGLEVVLNNNTIGGIVYNSNKATPVTIQGAGKIGSIALNGAGSQYDLSMQGGQTVTGAIQSTKGKTLHIDANGKTLTAGSVAGFETIAFKNLTDTAPALKLTDAQATQLQNTQNTPAAITVSGSLSDYNQQGKKYTLFEAANAVQVADDLFQQNTRTGNEFDVLSRTQYQVEEFGYHQNDAQSNLFIGTDKRKHAIVGQRFNEAQNLADATVNVLANQDYQNLIIYGSDANGLTMNINQAKGLGNIDTGKGSLKKLTMDNSSAQRVNVGASHQGEIVISNSEITSFGLNNGAGTEKVTLSGSQVKELVNALNVDTLNVIRTNAQTVNANQSKNVQIDGGTIGKVTAQGGAGGKNITIHGNVSVGDVSVDTFANSTVVIENASINSFGSNQSDKTSSLALTNAKVAKNVNAANNQLTIQGGSQVSGSVSATGGNVTINGKSTVTGNVTYSGTAGKLTIDGADTTVGGNVVATGGATDIMLTNNASVSGSVNSSNGRQLVIDNASAGNVSIDGTASAGIRNAAKVGNVTANNTSILITGKTTAQAVKGTGSSTVNVTDNSTIDSYELGADSTGAISNSTVNGTVTANAAKRLTMSHAQTGDIAANNTPILSIDNSTVGNITQNTYNGKEVGGKTIDIQNTTAKAVNIDTQQNSTLAISNSTIDSLDSSYSDSSSTVSLNKGEVKGNIAVNQNKLTIDGTTVSGNVSVKGATTIANAQIAGDINSSKAGEHSANITINNSSAHGVYGNQVNIHNSDVQDTVYAYQLDMAMDSNTVGKVWINSYNSQQSNVDSSISGTGTIGEIDFNPIDANANNAVGTLNINGNISVNGALANGNQKATLNINAAKGSLKADSITGWKTINFSNLSADHTALQLTQAADLGNKISLSGSLDDYDDGKKYSLIQSDNAVTVGNQLFAQNKVVGNEFDILSDAEYTVDEFGYHQDKEKKSLYINTENTSRTISNKQFNAADSVNNAVISINKAVDYQGLNVSAGGADSTIHWALGSNLGVIDGKGGVLNVGSSQTPTQMNARTASNIVNVGSLNFYLPDNIKNGDWAVSLSSNQATDLSKTAITAYLAGDSNINDKDTVALISKPNGGAISVGSTTVTAQQGITLTSSQEVKLSDDALALNLVFAKASQGGDSGGGSTGGGEGGSTGGGEGGSTGGGEGGSTGGGSTGGGSTGGGSTGGGSTGGGSTGGGSTGGGSTGGGSTGGGSTGGGSTGGG
ncbi:MAG: hypothetical protein IKI11_05745, partial [Neisseriaceae bacterium]|nr:hypothetical protein [Neisseriaceae bacterium]